MTTRKATLPTLMRSGQLTRRRRTAAASTPRDSQQGAFDPAQAISGLVVIALLSFSAWCEWQVVVWLASRVS